MSNVLPFPIAAQSSVLPSLTPREEEVVSLAYLTNREIGRVIGAELNTVRAHFRSIAIKLGTESRAQAYAVYVRQFERTAA